MSEHLSKEDLIDIHRRSLRERQIREHIGCESTNSVFKTDRQYKSDFYKYSICAVLEEFLQKHSYSVDYKVGLSENGPYSLKKEDLQISLDKYKKCVTEGCFFIKDAKGNKFVLELEESYGRDAWDISLYYKEEQEKSVLSFVTDLEKYATDNSFLKNSKIDPSFSHIAIHNKYTWDDVILPSSVKKELKTNIDNLFDNIQLYKKNDLSFKRGIILKGEPGTGKTLIGKVLCNQSKCSFVWVTPKFLQRASDIKAICVLAREIAPTILFLEDIDLYGNNRDDSSNASLLGELMNQLDGLVENRYIVTVATTNNAGKLEDALRNRPGRFDRIIDIPKPSSEGRIKMLKLHVGKCSVDNVNFESVAKKTKGYTGAHIRELVTTAVICAIEENSVDENQKVILKQEHFDKNIEKVKAKKVGSVGFNVDSTDIPPSLGDDEW